MLDIFFLLSETNKTILFIYLEYIYSFLFLFIFLDLTVSAFTCNNACDQCLKTIGWVWLWE